MAIVVGPDKKRSGRRNDPIPFPAPRGGGADGDDSIPILLPNVTRQRQIAAISAIDAAAAPSATDTTDNYVTIGSAKNWPDGTRVTVNSSGGGLTSGTVYYLNRISSTTFSFHTDVEDAYNDASRVDLTGSISATITPDAIVFCTIPADAFAAAIATFRNEGTGGNWHVRFAGIQPTTTVYSVKLGPGDTVLGTLGEAYTEENPPIGDVCVLHSNSAASGAGVIACYAAWNDGTSPLAGATGPEGDQGDDGNDAGFKYTFNSGTSGDPGSGKFLFNNSTFASATQINISETDDNALALATLFTKLDDSTSANKTLVVMIKQGGAAFFAFFITSTLTDNGAYDSFPITPVTSSGSLNNGDTFHMQSFIVGDKGGTGDAGEMSGSNFRIGMISATPIYTPQPATPSSTDTSTEIVTFAAAHGWSTGTMVSPFFTVGGLTRGTAYFINALSTTTCAFYTTYANAVANTSKVNLTANVTAAIVPYGYQTQTLYLTKYNGDKISLYDGSSWVVITPSSEPSLAVGTLTSGKNYDVFAYKSGSTAALEFSAAWTDTVTRSDAVVEVDGRPVKSSDHTRRLVATVRTVSTTEVELSTDKMFVSNYDNRLRMVLRRVHNSNSTYNYITLTWRQANASALNQVEVVVCWPGPQLSLKNIQRVGAPNNANGGGIATIGEDSTTGPSTESLYSYWIGGANNASLAAILVATLDKYPKVGYHTYTMMETGNGNGTNLTWFGVLDDSTHAINPGLTGFIEG